MRMMLRGRSRWFQVFSAATGGALFLFLVAPIFMSIMGSAEGIPEALGDPRITGSLVLSFYCGAIATVFSLFLGVPLAYVLSRYRFRGKSVLDALIDLPILIPHNAAGIALLFIFGPRTSFGGLFSGIGLS